MYTDNNREIWVKILRPMVGVRIPRYRSFRVHVSDCEIKKSQGTCLGFRDIEVTGYMSRMSRYRSHRVHVSDSEI